MDGEEPNDTSKTSNPSEHPNKPTKPPRPPPPNLKRPPSIAHHLDALQTLRPERVRWFWKQDKRWVPFCGRDSLAIEECYRKINELEKNSQEADPEKPLNTSVLYELPIVKGGLFEVDVVARLCTPIYWKEKGVPVCRGTWFIGVSASPDLWQPIAEEDAEQIENSHQTIWRAMGLHIGPTEGDAAKNEALGRLTLKGYYVEWNDITDVWLYWDDIKSRIIRGVGTKIGLASAASPIHRGYHTDSLETDKPNEITHLVFVVHGIGQLLNMSNIVKNANDLRESASKIFEKKIPGFPSDQRVEFLPVEWRASLKLDEGTVECVTPKTLSGLRNIVNTSMMDILYYTSPFYKYEIINGVRDEINRLYDSFCSRNPSFLEKHGKVSIVAHSLGSVITYDILSLWDIEQRHLTEEDLPTGFLTESFTYLRRLTSGEELETAVSSSEISSPSEKVTSPSKKGKNKRKENIRVELAKARNNVMELEAMLKLTHEPENEDKGRSHQETDCPYALRFKVENLFNIGSPLAVFLALRGIRPQDDVEDHVFPKSVCKRLFNIYHPADPVAYRMEPLINEDYASIKPMQLHRFDHTKIGYEEESKPPAEATRSSWSLFNYRVGYSTQKENSEESRSRSTSTSEDSEAQDDEVVIVDHAPSPDQEKPEVPKEYVPEKKGGWMSSWFGGQTKQTLKTGDQETDGTQGGSASDLSAKLKKKCEHIVVPSKVLNDRLDFVLKEGYMESNYLSAVTSHISYWGSCDVARFVLENTLDMEKTKKGTPI